MRRLVAILVLVTLALASVSTYGVREVAAISGSIGLTVQCTGSPERTTLTNNTDTTLRLSQLDLGTIYQPRTNEPFVLSIGGATLAPGASITFYSGTNAPDPRLTGQFIYDDTDPSEGARLSTPYGALTVSCAAASGTLAVNIPPSPAPSPSPSPSPGTFADVPVDYWAYAAIEQFARRGITTGCDVGLYCPERGVTRAEMAVFLDRTLGYANPAPPSAQRFTDVPPAYWAYAFIDQFAQLGVTTGCGGTEFCPDRGVSRAEMAAFLIRALGQSPLTPATATFADVPTSHPQYGYIEALVSLGVTTGCGTNDQGQRLYCPDRSVNRAEMAVFIIRAFP